MLRRQAGQHYEVRTAANLAEVESILDGGFAPELVITDYMMPGGSGHHVILAVKEVYPEAKCFIHTGNPNAINPEARDLADGVLAKGGNQLSRFLRAPQSYFKLDRPFQRSETQTE